MKKTEATADTLISVQDLRTALGGIARRVEAGESFTVVRNSKPSFRIIPLGAPDQVREPRAPYRTNRSPEMESAITVEEIQRRFAESGANRMITPEELDELIHEVHREHPTDGRDSESA